MAEPDLVHFSDWSQQPDVRVLCDQTYSRPAWGQPWGLAAGVFALEDSRLYTFEQGAVTCPQCLEALGKIRTAGTS
jgi:hypothetical protein